MTAAEKAKVLRSLREFTAESVRRDGIEVAYCWLCGCNKSGDVDEPNACSPGCSAAWCLCHTEEAE